MSRNGSGTYTLPAGNPVVTGTTISSTWSNTTLTDIATALTGSLAADGQTTATGNLKMGANRITGLADGVASTDGATVSQVTASVAGLGTMSTQNASAVAITGGTINGTTLGATTRADGKFTTLAANGNVSLTSTGFLLIPSGTTAQRSASPAVGEIRYNTDNSVFEGYASSSWGQLGGGLTNGGTIATGTITTLTTTTISDGTNSTSSTNLVKAPCKAWVKYNGIAQTIFGSYNVSSVTYLASGRYQVNFTNAFGSANYAACVTAAVDGTINVDGAFKFGAVEQASTYLAGSCVIGTAVPNATSNTGIISAIFVG
jgi:hypothetical protein